MLALELGCTNDGNKRIVASKGVTTWRFRTRETKSQEGPPCSNVVADGKGEITSIVTKEEDVTFNNVGNHSPPKLECEDFEKPSPSKHTSQSGTAFWTFLLLAKYHNNGVWTLFLYLL